ncbi:lipopolysaccharide biosynthesis protein [uncultured Roseovarius sp.]|uniref:GumC family protein n=1 Tax=uncultured Roseovarius sp. TaxID=293344 RepID=UPI002605BB33|nr:lipopolysaccharide biosynthesis protein [uncultured Roseovarius sp.]
MMLDFKFFASLFLRRLHYFLVVTTALSAFGLTVAYTLPAGYEAKARLLVESPQIPGDLASSTVRTGAAELLEIISQRVMTRASLLDIARKFDLYKDQRKLSTDDIVADMRKRIKMSLPGRRDAASFVTVSYRASTGTESAQVANELVTLILQQNRTLRTSATGQTLDFFRNEVKKLDEELAEQGQRILKFKGNNQGALPDSLDYRRNRQASLQERVLQMERELASLRDRRTRLVDLYQRTGQIELTGEALSPEEQRLQELSNQLASALVLYSDTNPRVKALMAQVDAAQNQVASKRRSTGGGLMSAYEVQLADLDGQMEFLIEEKKTVETELLELEESIDRTPANAITLSSLERDYDNIRVQYNQATADFAAARTGDQIEAQSRGQRITVIEQATVPNAPTSPKRKKIAFSGAAGGIFAGLAVVILIELLNTSIRRSVDLTNRLGITPFVTIPYIRTRGQANFRRFVIFIALLVVGLGIPITLFLLHTYYLPMDLLIEKVLNKFGISDLIKQFRQGFGN